jgi:hypothetical protein
METSSQVSSQASMTTLRRRSGRRPLRVLGRAKGTVAAWAAIAWLVAASSCSKPSGQTSGLPEASATTTALVATVSAVASATAPAASAGGLGVLRKLSSADECEEEKVHADCVLKACTPALQECYGKDADTGRLSGACKDYGECSMLCTLDPDPIGRAACDLDCTDRHRASQSECDRCLAKVDACSRAAGCKPFTACR